MNKSANYFNFATKVSFLHTNVFPTFQSSSPIISGCRIQTAALQRGKTYSQRVSWIYNIKQPDGKVPVLELRGM